MNEKSNIVKGIFELNVKKLIRNFEFRNVMTAVFNKLSFLNIKNPENFFEWKNNFLNSIEIYFQ